MNYDDILAKLDSINNGKVSKRQTIVDPEIVVRHNKEQKEDNKKKREFVTFKYSQNGKGELHESVLINDVPFFIKFNQGTKVIELVDKIEENNRVLRAPYREEYPYSPYTFSSLDEINSYKDMIQNNTKTIDFLFTKSKSIISKYNKQDDYKLTLVAADVLLSYFQDRFSTIHYDYFVGGNGSGKSSLADTMGAIGYRVINMTDPTAPNLFRSLGLIEASQCTIVLEEAERIDKSQDLMAVLKTGSSRTGRVPRINGQTEKQEFFFSYCLKIIVSERSLNQSIARGVNTRIFSIHCFKGRTKYDIKEVLNPTDTGGPQKKSLLNELEYFRKFLLIYRLMHFKDSISDLDIGLDGRDKELVKPLIQLFYRSNSLNPIIETLQKFIDIKNKKKESTLDYALLPIISNLINQHGARIFFRTFWDALQRHIPGKADEKKPNEYHTEDYGTIYRNSITGFLTDRLGATTDHSRDGNILIFDPHVIENLSMKEKTKITVKELSNEIEHISEVYDDYGNIDSDEFD